MPIAARRDGFDREVNYTDVLVLDSGACRYVVGSHDHIVGSSLGSPGVRLQHSVGHCACECAQRQRQYSNEYKSGTIHLQLHRNKGLYPASGPRA